MTQFPGNEKPKSTFELSLSIKGNESEADIKSIIQTAWAFCVKTGISVNYRYRNENYTIDENTDIQALIEQVQNLKP